MFYLANDITKPWGVFLKGSPIEVISAREKSAIVIKCGSDTLTVSQYDLTDVNPTPEKKLVKVESKHPAIKHPEVKVQKVESITETPKHKKVKVSQPTIF